MKIARKKQKIILDVLCRLIYRGEKPAKFMFLLSRQPSLKLSLRRIGVSWNRAKEGYGVGIQIGNENTKKFSIEGGIETWNIA